MIETIALLVGYMFIFILTLGAGAFLLWFIYCAYNYLLKRILAWDTKEGRDLVWYFIKNREEIIKCIERKKKRKLKK